MISIKCTGKRLAATLLVIGAVGAASFPAAASKPVEGCPQSQLVQLVAHERDVDRGALRATKRVQKAQHAARIIAIEAIHRGHDLELASGVAFVDRDRFIDRDLESLGTFSWDGAPRDLLDDESAADSLTGTFVDVVVGGARFAARASVVADHLAVAAAKITSRALHSLL